MESGVVRTGRPQRKGAYYSGLGCASQVCAVGVGHTLKVFSGQLASLVACSTVPTQPSP